MGKNIKALSFALNKNHLSGPMYLNHGILYILYIYSEKQLKNMKNYFDFITFGNIIFKQIIFVIDRIITMQFTKMQVEIHGSLFGIQYYTKCTDPLYPKFTSKKISALNFC